MNLCGRWEQGSDFHWLVIPDEGYCKSPWPEDAPLFGSGRDALRALLRHGRRNLAWRVVFLPSYLCPDVVRTVLQEGIPADVYPDDPRTHVRAPDPGPDGAVVIVNTFGVRKAWRRPKTFRGCVIEDHTHDPWSAWAEGSEADYCVASLRKTLPIPDGGVLWSPRAASLPASPALTEAHELASGQRLSAMVLKGLYLTGRPVHKETYRRLFETSEKAIFAHRISGISPLSAAIVKSLNAGPWREHRRENHAHLTARIAGVAGIEVLTAADAGGCPFSVVAVCSHPALREKLRLGLVARRIYPAVLWPMDRRSPSAGPDDDDLSRRILSVHCDGRYGREDMERVAEAINQATA